ncbi:diguanylate cyclase domain-containing protein [Halomonas sp. HK25]|uniref:diguanylate cyclase domain-containing protein n=1 Tax=Halomonas sp. HK25 TaxID=3394321 RepID=UPI0039FCFBD7
MPTSFSSQPSRHIQRLHRKVSILAALGILITALLAGLATALPFYFASRDSLESITRLSAEAHAEALHHQLRRYQDVANQFTSRTEIRHRLEAYARGELSLEALSDYSTPRLTDAMGQAPEVAGLVRFGPDNEVVARLGLVPDGPPIEVTASAGNDYPCRLHVTDDNEMLVQACAPIVVDEDQRIGRDVVFFHADPLLSLLANTERLGKDATMVLRESNGRHDLRLEESGPALTAVDPPGETGRRTHVTFETPLGDQNWQLLVSIPAQRFRDEALTVLLWPALAVLLLTVGGALLVSRVLHPLLARVASQARRLEYSEQELRLAASVFRQAREAILITDQHHAIVEVNPAFTQLTGHPSPPLIGRPLTDLLSPQDNLERAVQAVLETLGRKGVWQGEMRYRCANDDTLVALQTISAVRDTDGALLRHIHIFNDISEQKAAEEEIRHQALHDELTGLPNRTLLYERLTRAIHHTGQGDHLLAVLFLDLDNFKRVNDTLGHQSGDELLKQVARRLRGRLRERDTLARLSGDEFVVVLEGLSQPVHAARVADGIVKALLDPFMVAGETVHIGASVGVALYPGNGDDGEALLKAADVAMYRAKDAGRSTWRLHDRTRDLALRGDASP